MEDDESEEVYGQRIHIVGIVTRDRRFLRSVEQVFEFSWLENKTPEKRREALPLLMPSFACGCVENDDFVSLQEILQKSEVNSQDYDGFTPMHQACQNGKFDMVKYLMSKGATTQLKNRHGCTPLYLAIKSKHSNIIKILMFMGASVMLEPEKVAIEVIKAVKTADYQLLHAWYLAGVNMDQGDYNGRTALHAAVMNKDPQMVAKLLQYGAIPLVKDIWGRTALNEARRNNLHSILNLFCLSITENFNNEQAEGVQVVQRSNNWPSHQKITSSVPGDNTAIEMTEIKVTVGLKKTQKTKHIETGY